MIAVEKFGSNFMGALGYNLKKLDHPDKKMRAVVLATSFSSLSPGMIKKEIDLIKNLRPGLKKHVWHTSLNFSIEEMPANLTNEKLLEIGMDYMKAMGYDDNQYLIVRHHDAEHPHIHFLVNRIKLDGGVVSDSNNFRRSQALLRRLEQQYNLIPLEQHNEITTITQERYNRTSTDKDTSVTAELDNYISIEQNTGITAKQSNDITQDKGNDIAPEHDNGRSEEQSNRVTKRSLTKDEIEKTLRTGIPSDKSVLQELLEPMIFEKRLKLQEFIDQCQQAGISLLFNQASTGKVSGITYFINDFKIKGQALGNRFKWAEIIKHIDHEQDRDSQAISQANNRTKAKYGELSAKIENTIDQRPATGRRASIVDADTGANAEERDRERQGPKRNDGTLSADDTSYDRDGNEVIQTLSLEQQQTDSYMDTVIGSYNASDIQSYNGIEIADDVDDEAVHGKKRHRQKNGKLNRR